MADTIKAPSRSEQVKEILACGTDPAYFIRKYVKIQHPEKGTIPFGLYPFQEDCVKDFEKHRKTILLKARQLGISTLCAAYAVWLAVFHRDKTILVIATKLPTAMNFIKKCKVAIQSLPTWLLLPKFEPTKQAIGFSNGSSITAIPTSEDAGRSEALSLLIVDEAAFIRDFEDIWTGLAPTINTGGNVIILSSPHGVGGQYYRLWVEAEANQNGFHPIRLAWDVHPEHDQKWFDNETRSFSRRKIAQEYECDFATSGDTFLQPNVLDELRAQIQDPTERTGPGGNVWVWSPPVEGHSYVISADVARGDGQDYSTFHVLDVEDCEVSAEYMGKIPPEEFADVLAEWGKRYNGALLVPEQNTFGYFVNKKLSSILNYKKLYYKNNKGDPFNYIPLDQNELPGFQTDQKTRVQILTKLEELIRSKVLKTYSRRTYEQLQAFVWHNNKPQAGKDSHDDLVMSLAIAAWLVEGNQGMSEQATAMAYAILNATKMVSKDIDTMPGNINEAKPLVNPSIKGVNPNSVYRPRDPETVSRNPMLKDVSDFRWLLK